MKKRDFMVFQFVVVQMCVHIALSGLQTCIICLTLPKDLYYMSANSKGSGETALMLVAYVISFPSGAHICCAT